MKIHVVCTKNGQMNEGMNNIEAHFTKRFLEKHEVTTSSLRDIAGLLRNAIKADCIIFYCRATEKTYWMMKLASLFCSNVWEIVVQKPEQGFIDKQNKKPLKCSFLYLSHEDIKELRLGNRQKVVPFSVGLNVEKFKPVDRVAAENLKKKYGFSTDKPLVVHVGHASEGRGVEDLALLDGAKFSRLFVDSGIFDNPAQAELLENNGVTILRGFLEYVEEIYQMADAYLFPTKSGDYVISVPLSVMEALSCGTPAVSYKSMKVSQSINGIAEGALCEIESEKQLNVALQEIVNRKTDHSLISGCMTWNEAADQVEKVLFCKDVRK